MYADENILYFNEGSSNVISNCNRMGILNIDLYNIDLDETNYAIILIRLLAWHIKFQKSKELKQRQSRN